MVLGAPGGQGGQLEEGRVPVDQQLDPLVGQQLAPLLVALHVALAAAGPGHGQLLVDRRPPPSSRARSVGPEGLRVRVDGGGQDGHGQVIVGEPGRIRTRRRGKNRPMTSLPRHEGRPIAGIVAGAAAAMVIRTYPQGPGTGTTTAAADRSARPGARSSAVVLAAGEGTRMRSARPKPLHRLCGRPMVLHVLDALAELSVHRVVVVVGHRAEWVTKTLIEHAPPGMAIEFVEQVEQRGTGDAMSVALTGLPDDDGDDDGDVVVLPGRHAAPPAGHAGRAGPPAPRLGCRRHAAHRGARRPDRLRPGGAGPGRLGGPGGRARRRHRRGARRRTRSTPRSTASAGACWPRRCAG